MKLPRPKSARQIEREGRARDARNVKALVGRTIIAAEPRAALEGETAGDACWMHGWRLTLDNGARVVFSVEEHPEGTDYGVDLAVYRGRP